MPKKIFSFRRNVNRPRERSSLAKRSHAAIFCQHRSIDLVQAGRMRVPETVDSAALLQYGRQADQYSEYSDGNRHHRAETQ